MAAPDFIICLNCETPCYVFEFGDDGIEEALCLTCGNDEPDQFVTEDEFDALTGAEDPRKH